MVTTDGTALTMISMDNLTDYESAPLSQNSYSGFFVVAGDSAFLACDDSFSTIIQVDLNDGSCYDAYTDTTFANHQTITVYYTKDGNCVEGHVECVNGELKGDVDYTQLADVGPCSGSTSIVYDSVGLFALLVLCILMQ